LDPLRHEFHRQIAEGRGGSPPEAVDIRRELARARPAAFTPNLAMSLNNLANVLSDLGRCEEALTAAQEAVDIRRALARRGFGRD